MGKYYRENHAKYMIKCHLIFVCKYRKRLLFGSLDSHMKQIIRDIVSISDFNIEVMETDLDHIHFLISYPPKLSLTSIVRRLKQISTINIWKLYPNFLRQHFWKEHTFWSDGYFVCSIGEANPDTIRKYIEQQG
jgi:putative transposase